MLPLEGEIDLHVSPNVAASLNMMIEKKPKQLVVDLSRVTYIDSAGLAAFIEAMQNVEAYGGKFALAGLHLPGWQPSGTSDRPALQVSPTCTPPRNDRGTAAQTA